MKKIAVGINLLTLVLSASAVDVRERGTELMQRFKAAPFGEVVTNGSECIRTTMEGKVEYKFFYSQKSGELRKIQVSRSDGGIDLYGYSAGRLQSAACSTTNRMSMVVTQFVGNGTTTNDVDRIECDMVEGKLVGPMRFLDANGKRINVPKPPARPSYDKEYIPKPGWTTKVGPYEWTIVGPGRTAVLSRNGKMILHSNFCLGGKYPWVFGHGREDSASANREELRIKGISPSDQYSGVAYYFVIDMRTDEVMYIPENERGEIDRITGLKYGECDEFSFWALALSKRGPKRLAKLEAALKPQTNRVEH